MRVEDIGGQNRSFVPGASSLVIEGMPGVTNTSHLRATSPALVSVSDMSDFLCDAVSADHDRSNSMPTRIPMKKGLGIDFLLTLHFLFQAVFSMKSDWTRGCNPVIGAWLINALSY